MCSVRNNVDIATAVSFEAIHSNLLRIELGVDTHALPTHALLAAIASVGDVVGQLPPGWRFFGEIDPDGFVSLSSITEDGREMPDNAVALEAMSLGFGCVKQPNENKARNLLLVSD